MTRLLLAALAAAATIAAIVVAAWTLRDMAATPAQAQPPYEHRQYRALCMDRAALVGTLGRRYGEARVAGGLVGDDGRAVVEIFAAPDGATYSIVVTGTDGKACLPIAGQEWGALPPLAAGEPL